MTALIIAIVSAFAAVTLCCCWGDRKSPVKGTFLLDCAAILIAIAALLAGLTFAP